MAQQPHSIYVKRVEVTRLHSKNNLIICRRVISKEKLREFYRDLERDVAKSPNERRAIQNGMYAVEFLRGWCRAMLKFVRHDDVPVLQLVDEKGNVDFDNNLIVRKVTDPNLSTLPHLEFKLFIYGMGTYFHDDELYAIFDQCVMNKVVTCIYALMEQKENKIHESYAGDLLYEEGNRMLSLRELLIRKNLTYPSRSKNNINRPLFKMRTTILAERNKPVVSTAKNDPIDIIGRLEIHDILGEGGVSLIFEANIFYGQ